MRSSDAASATTRRKTDSPRQSCTSIVYFSPYGPHADESVAATPRTDCNHGNPIDTAVLPGRHIAAAGRVRHQHYQTDRALAGTHLGTPGGSIHTGAPGGLAGDAWRRHRACHLGKRESHPLSHGPDDSDPPHHHPP